MNFEAVYDLRVLKESKRANFNSSLDRIYQRASTIIVSFKEVCQTIFQDAEEVESYCLNDFECTGYFEFGSISTITSLVAKILNSMTKDFVALDHMIISSMDERELNDFVVDQSFLLNNLSTSETLFADLGHMKKLEETYS